MVIAALLEVIRNTERVSAKSAKVEAMALAQRGGAIGVAVESDNNIYRDDPLMSFKSDKFNEGYEVTVSSEATKLHINSVLGTSRKDKSLILTLFEGWGVEFDVANSVTDALVDWIDSDKTEELNGAEEEYYIEQGSVDRPYNRNFEKVEDMRMVKDFGLIEAVKPNWRDYFTVYGDTKLDIHEVDKELLALASELDKSTVESFITRVRGEDGKLGTEDDEGFSTLSDALDTLGVTTDPDARKLVSDRFKLRSTVKRIVSKGYVNKTVFEIDMVFR